MKTHPQLHQNTTPASADRYGADSANSSPPKRQPMALRDMLNVTVHHMHLLSDGMGGMIHAQDIAIAEQLRDEMALPDDPAEAMPIFFRKLNEEITSQARARGIEMPDLNALALDNPSAPVEYIFPHYFLLPQFGNASSYRIRPLGPESCLFELWALSLLPDKHKGAALEEPEPSSYLEDFWPAIPKQDYANLPLQQLGLHAKGFEYMRLSKDVEGTISNYQRLIDGYLTGVDRAALARGSQIASSPLDTPVRDLGF